MKSLKNEILPFPAPGSVSVLSWAKGHDKSVVSGIWRRQVAAIEDMFGGGTDEALEDKALNILLKAGTYAELAFMVNRLTWDVLDDELDEQDNTQIAERLSVLRDRVEHTVDDVFRRLSLRPETFQDTPAATVAQSIQERVGFLGGAGQTALANHLLARRVGLLDAIALFALRNMPTRSRELVILLENLASRLPAVATGLTGLRWEAFYDNRVCVQLEQARYRVLIATLPDMVDPALPVERREALFDTLNRRDNEFRAMQTFISVLGTAEQRTSVASFMDARQLFMDNFTPGPPTPDAIGVIAAFFNSGASEIVGLRSDVAGFGQNLIDALTIAHLLEDERDDKAREAVGALGTRRAFLPSHWKAALIRMMEEGTCDDDDEQAILQLLTDTKARSIAEFAQLIGMQGWESLSFSFDGQEYDDLELLLSKW